MHLSLQWLIGLKFLSFVVYQAVVMCIQETLYCVFMFHFFPQFEQVIFPVVKNE